MEISLIHTLSIVILSKFLDTVNCVFLKANSGRNIIEEICLENLLQKFFSKIRRHLLSDSTLELDMRIFCFPGRLFISHVKSHLTNFAPR